MRSLIIITLCFLQQFATAQNNFVRDSLDTYVNREMKRWQVPGLAIVIVKDGKVVAMKGYGVREVGKTEKVDENTLFQIASNTKAFTGTCVALLNHQKKLSLDDKVTKWLPDFKLYDDLATRDVTIRDILCHRVGFRTFQGDFLNWNSSLSRTALVEKLRYLKPSYGFRERWGYFNMGFVSAGEVIKAATDTTWEDYMTAHLLKPLQMHRTTARYETFVNESNKASCYTIYNDSLVKIPYANIDNIGASASMSSSVNDLSHWLIMQLDSGRYNNKSIVPYNVIRDTRRALSLVGEHGDGPTHFVTYGLGWFIEDYDGRKIANHSGGTNGFVTQTLLCPEEKLGVVVLTNTDANGLYSALAYQVLESYLNMPYRSVSAENYAGWLKGYNEDQAALKKMRDTVAQKNVPTMPLQYYTGRYRNDYYGNIDITKESNGLTIRFEHHPTVVGRLQGLGGNNFVCTYSDKTWGIQRIPFTTRESSVQSVTIKVNDFIDYMSYEFTKIK